MAAVLGNPLGYQRVIVDGEDLNNITNNGYYIIRLSSSGSLINSPIYEGGGLIVININYFLVQIAIGGGAENTYIRTKWGSSAMMNWRSII